VEAKLRDLGREHPDLARGGLSWDQLVTLARRIGAARGVEVDVRAHSWPWGGSVQWFGSALAISIDDRRPRAEQVWALAHEVGHLALGHCHLEEPEHAWCVHAGSKEDLEQEAAAECFAAFATRAPGGAAPLRRRQPPSKQRRKQRRFPSVEASSPIRPVGEKRAIPAILGDGTRLEALKVRSSKLNVAGSSPVSRSQ
jgi:hypothetical protein